jgi:hypothetical protein
MREAIDDLREELAEAKREHVELVFEEAESRFKECAVGFDDMNYQNNRICEDFYKKAVFSSSSNIEFRKKLQVTRQNVRDYQMRNLLLEEKIDELMD